MFYENGNIIEITEIINRINETCPIEGVALTPLLECLVVISTLTLVVLMFILGLIVVGKEEMRITYIFLQLCVVAGGDDSGFVWLWGSGK